MKIKKGKKFIAIASFAAVIAVILSFSNVVAVLAQAWNVEVSTSRFVVDGEVREINALNTNGRNYVSIADIAELLDINVSFDENTNTVYLEQAADTEPIRTVDVTNTLSDREIAHVIEIDIPILHPQQHIVLDDMFELLSGDIITYDISFGDARSGVMVGFVRDKTWTRGDALFWGAILDSISSVEPGRMYFETTFGLGLSHLLSETYLIIRNQHPVNSGEVVENIRGTVTISR